MSSHASNFVLRPGPGFQYDPETGSYRIEAAMLVGGVSIGLTTPGSAAQPPLNYRLDLRCEGPAEGAPAPLPAVSEFVSAEALSDLGFVYPAGHRGWNLKSNEFGRLMTPSDTPAHGAWSKAGGDGIYRSLFRILGANLAPSPDRRFCFGARVRVEGGDLHGTRIDLYAEDGPRIGISDYTGKGSATRLVAAAASDWQHGTWCWLDVSVAGATVRARVYPEGSAAPDWQITGVTGATGTGGFGPGGVPGLAASPVIDIRRLEFQPVS